MIDLHCHLLPEMDDGSKSWAESLDMARLAVADGISVVACTPHILPGIYDNEGQSIRAAAARLQSRLDDEAITLALTTGADVHLTPNVLEGLRSGRILALADSRYVLLEPPQAIVPPRFEDHLFGLVTAGYVPIITHPERLAWSERDYALLERVVRLGGWMQLTGGSLLGRFGNRAKAWAERMLTDGLAHIVASDAHDASQRPPYLSGAFVAAARLIGRDAALHLVHTRPAGILANEDPGKLPPPLRIEMGARRRRLRLAGD